MLVASYLINSPYVFLCFFGMVVGWADPPERFMWKNAA